MLNHTNSVREGMLLLSEKAPHIYYTQGPRIQGMLQQRIGAAAQIHFSLADFNRDRLNLEKPVILYGKSDSGKTAFAKAHFKSPLLVKRQDDLKKITHMTDGIIFDDFNFVKNG